MKALLTSALALGALTSAALAAPPALPPELEEVRQALEKYRDPIVAVRDGYLSTLGCVEYPVAAGEGHVQYAPGGMGVHFINPGLIGPELDPLRPTILVYAPDGDKLRLVAAEWLVPLATGIRDRPELFGQPFYGPMEGHEPLMPAELHHYDLHVWLFEDNPAGLFAPTNPVVTCEDAAYAPQGHVPRLVPHPQP